MTGINSLESYRLALARAYRQSLNGESQQPVSIEVAKRQLGLDLRRGLMLPELSEFTSQGGRLITAEMLGNLPQHDLFYGPLTYNPCTQLVEIEQAKTVSFTSRENDIFHPLISYPEALLPYLLILQILDYPSTMETAGMRNLRTMLNRMRGKLGDTGKFIQTIQKSGIILKLAA